MNDSYYLYSSGSLKQKDKTIEFTSADGEKRSLPIENIRDIYIMSEMQMTTKLLELFGKYGINVHFFNYYQYYVGSFCPKESMLSGQLLVKQVGAYSDNQQRIYIAQNIIKAAAKKYAVKLVNDVDKIDVDIKMEDGRKKSTVRQLYRN